MKNPDDIFHAAQKRLTDKSQEHIWTLSSESMSELSIQSFQQFLSMANNAHTIDITMRADAKNYSFQADFLKYMKWVPVYRNDVTGELEDVAYKHLEKTIAYHERFKTALEEIESSCSDDFETGGFLCKELPENYKELWIAKIKEIARKALGL